MEKVKIFGLGLPKTAGSSFSLFLHNSGIKTIHDPIDIMLSYYKNDLTGSKDLHGYDAIVGMVGLIYKELYDLYPEAKYILTMRDKDKWLNSCEKHFASPRRQPSAIRLRKDFFGCNVYNKEKFSNRYDEYNDQIISFFKGQNNFLVSNISNSNTDDIKEFLGLKNDINLFPHIEYDQLVSMGVDNGAVKKNKGL